MIRFVLLSFAFLGWAFFEVSGGGDFAPEPPERIARFEALEAERAQAARKAEQARRAAIAEKARLAEAERAAMRMASLDLGGNGAATSPTAMPPLTRRHTLVSQPVATPEDQRADLTPSPEALRAAEVEAAALAELAKDVRSVRGSRVNMRGGPGVGYSVLATLGRGDRVEVLQDPGSGWVKLKVIDSGRIGWMSARLLQKQE
ncbi:SH3 domain-containing protein [Shimia sp.]|uniref:SH3 domain-containing protein n=1 Tax=Shimia sp. TaxID=1954381 RepID=UPI00356A54F9